MKTTFVASALLVLAAGVGLAQTERPRPPAKLSVRDDVGDIGGALDFPPQARTVGIPEHYKLLYEQTFESPQTVKDFAFSDAKAWRVGQHERDFVLELHGQSKYTPKHRSPFNIALIADKVFGDFIFDLDIMSTVKPYNHQDMCLFFGFEATNKYYYAHIAVKPDPNAHNIFIVNDAPRKNIAKEVSDGVTWGSNIWHKVRLERKLGDGAIRVYFDDLTKPIMTTQDKTCGQGYLGVGSFDDKGKFRRFRVFGPAMTTKKTDFFQRGQ